MKLFELTLGSSRFFGVAKDMEEMHEKRAELDATFAFTPVDIVEVDVPGYQITVKAAKDKPPEN